MNAVGSVINHPCTLCCRPTSMWCSRCQSAWYCTPEHLQMVSTPLRFWLYNLDLLLCLHAVQDWPRHRRECIPATHAQNHNMIVTPPPAEQQMITVSAILFGPEGELLCLVHPEQDQSRIYLCSLGMHRSSR
ncbi:hypothetical protein EV401DRAFT_292420 [Pisolithus croceorrhizus]|nr:hypothetical protein EV401DRAFT_292420 [Pisolithus croceorrhizus]